MIGLLKDIFGGNKVAQSNDAVMQHNQSTLGSVSGNFSMEIDDVFFISGRGLVVVGTIQSGSVSVGDMVTAGSKKVAVNGIEKSGESAETALAGDIVGLHFSDLNETEVSKGSVIIK